MKYNEGLNKSNKKQTKIFNEKNLLGLFALVILMLATFGSFFLNTAQASNSSVFQLADDPVTGCPDGYTALGGIIASNPTASVINSRVVVFARGTDGTIYYQISTGFPFSGWVSLGGGTNSAPMSIVIGSTLYVEVVGTDGNRYYRSTIDGSTYTNWTQGTVGATTNSTAVLGTISYTFVRGATGSQPNLCAFLGSPATPTPTATPIPSPTGSVNAVTGCPAGYAALGGVVNSVPTANVINGRVVVFVRASTGEIYFQYSSGGAFSGWNNLGNTAASAPTSIVIGSTLYVEILSTDGSRYYKSSPDGLGFTSWIKGTIGGSITPSATLGTTGYNFVSGLTGSSPNLCALVTPGVTPTPTPTPVPTTTPTPTGTPDAVTGCPAGYTALGGVVGSAPTSGVINGRVVAFVRGTNGVIFYQHSTNLTFSGWISLGGGTNSAPMSRVIGSTLYVEVVGTDGNRYYRSTTDGLNFTDWTAGTFGATVNSSVILGTTGYTFASGLTGSSPNLCVFFNIGTSPTPTPTFTPTPTPTGTPDTVTGCPVGYTALGGTITSDPTTNVINNRVLAFGRGTDNVIYYQYSNGGSSFSGWISLGGATNSAPMSIVIGSTLYVEVVGTDGNRYYRSTNDGLTFSNWTAGTFGATTNSSSVLGTTGYTFIRGSAGSSPNLCALITASVTVTPTPTVTATPNNSTGCAADFVSLGGIITSNPTTSVFNNRLYVFARGTDGAIYYQTTVGSAFSNWIGLGGVTNAAPKSIVIGSTLSVEVVGTDNNNYYKSTTDGTNFSNWTSGTVNATTNSVAVFGGKTYTFAAGVNNAPHLCVKIQ